MNEILSQQRAEEVANFFTQQQAIPPEKVVSRGCGATIPVDSNDTPEGRAKNRRVEIILIK